MIGALSYHVTTSCLTNVFLDETNFLSSRPYVISSHKRCDAQKHTTTVYSYQVLAVHVPASVTVRVLLSPLLGFTPYG